MTHPVKNTRGGGRIVWILHRPAMYAPGGFLTYRLIIHAFLLRCRRPPDDAVDRRETFSEPVMSNAARY